MKPRLERFGAGNHPVVVVDAFSENVDRIIALASSIAPFPSASGSYYPGVRRAITEADGEAWDYVADMCQRAAQFIAGAFGVEAFDLLEASFSMVTSSPAELRPAQRAPHFDSTNPRYFALLHYLNVPERSGTAFYRQRATEIEQVTESNISTFVRTAERAAAAQAIDAGYIQESDAHYEQIGALEAVADRLLIYQGSLLHSGIIPPDMPLSSDPAAGRLTTNIFVQGH